MVLWIMLRAFKFYFITSETAIRYFWYAYYLPMLFIPTLALFVALSIGKHEGYRLPKTTLLLLVRRLRPCLLLVRRLRSALLELVQLVAPEVLFS